MNKITMEYAQDYLEIKKQMLELMELTNKSIESKTMNIHKELVLLQQENKIISQKFREYIEKLDGLSFRTNTTFNVTEMSSQLGGNGSVNHKKNINKSDGKINIQNLVINKKVQIGKHFSKLNISNISTSPNKPNNFQIDHSHFNHQMKKIPHFNGNKNPSIIKMRIYSKNKTKNSSANHSDTSNQSKVNTENHSTLNHDDHKQFTGTITTPTNQKRKKKNDLTLKTSKSINDVRKFSIMDIPSFDMKDISNKHNNKNQKSMRNYLYNKNQKFYYLLAKQNILPLELRLTFSKKIANFYTKEDVYQDYSHFIISKYNQLVSLKHEFKQFVPSMTSQVALNFITCLDEKSCLKMIENVDNDTSNQLTEEQLRSFYDLLIVFYYLVNEPIDDSLPKDPLNLFKDLLTRVLQKNNSQSLKEHQLQLINKKFILSPYQLARIQAIYRKIVNEYNFKPFDKVSSAMLFILKDIYEYSLIKMSNGDAMIKYNYDLARIDRLKAELE